MICPNCKKQVDIGKAVKEHDDDYWNETSGPAMGMVSCEECEEQVFMVDVIPLGKEDFEEVESPALGGIVKVPKPNTTDNDVKDVTTPKE